MDSPWAHTALAIVCLLLPAAAGCNSRQRVQQELFQRELRQHEDEIYRLEDYIEEYQSIIRGYRCEVAELKRELKTKPSDAGRTATPTLAPPRAPEVYPPAPVETEPEAPLDDAPEMPSIEAPSIDQPPEVLDPPEAIGDFESTLDEPPPLFNGANAQPIPSADPTNNAPVATVAAVEATPATDEQLRVRVTEMSRALAGVWSLEVALRDDHDPDCHATASVMLTDPKLQGVHRRLARWDFTATELREARHADGVGKPVTRLTIALPPNTPKGRPLRVWVRLIDPDGAKRLQATSVVLRAVDNVTAENTGDSLPWRNRPSGGPIDPQIETRRGLAWRTPAAPRFDRSVTPAGYVAPAR